MRRRLTLALALMAGLVLTLTVAACGSSSGGETTPPPNYAKALKGAPAPLATLYSEANELLPGGKDAFEKRVGELGYPVVANVWASWCGPCRLEFSIFQQVSAKWGKKVAFLGVDAEDSKAAAEEWLKERPVPYPTYFEVGGRHRRVAEARRPARHRLLRRARANWSTSSIGQYTHESELEADIKKYALQSPRGA